MILCSRRLCLWSEVDRLIIVSSGGNLDSGTRSTPKTWLTMCCLVLENTRSREIDEDITYHMRPI